jgi:hypothetical protein
VWSIGGATDEEGRAKFDGYLRGLLTHNPSPEISGYITPGTPHKITTPFPEGKTVSAMEGTQWLGREDEMAWRAVSHATQPDPLSLGLCPWLCEARGLACSPVITTAPARRLVA